MLEPGLNKQFFEQPPLPPKEIEYIGGYREPPPEVKFKEELGGGIGIYEKEWNDKYGKTYQEYNLFPTGLTDKEKLRGSKTIDELEALTTALKKHKDIYSLVLEKWLEKEELKNTFKTKNVDSFFVFKRFINEAEMAARAQEKTGKLNHEEMEKIIDKILNKYKEQYKE